MKAQTSTCCGVTLTRVFLGGVLASLSLAAVWAAVVLAAPRKQRSPLEATAAEGLAKPDGKELFAREWLPHDPRSPRGDGLGPVFNDTSCVACHNQGGAGGGGPASKNVHILTTTNFNQQRELSGRATAPQSFVLHHFGTDEEFATWRAKMAQAASVAMGPFSRSGPTPLGFNFDTGIQFTLPSVPPGGSTPPAATAPKAESPTAGPAGGKSESRPGTGGPRAGGSAPGTPVQPATPVQVTSEVISGKFIQRVVVGGNSLSQRNATALFGAGKIDAIPEEVLVAVAATKHAQFPKVVGRVARDDKGRVGRFGWKAQKASLDDFVLTACAVELGLDVPGHAQPPLPHKADYKAPGLDLTKDECDALVKYVGDLPAPAQLKAEHTKHTEFIASGKALFGTVGCATCHTPKLGDVEGIYSDLLLHDMGPGLTDIGSSYGIFQPNPSTPSPEKPREIVKADAKTKPPVVATAQEWRTPPLWGVRDSGPYLHDGRATTLEQAVAFHGGQAEESTKKFNALSVLEKQKLLAFLKSLVAPEQLAAR